MRTTLAVCLFCLTVLSVGARPDEPRRVWDWPKEKAFRDGPTVYTLDYLAGEQDEQPWFVTFKVKNAGEAAMTRKEAFGRWYGVKVADDTGRKIVVTKSVASAGDFPPGRTGEYSLSFGNRPDKKAKEVHIDFADVEGRPPLRLAIPAAKVRDLKARN